MRDASRRKSDLSNLESENVNGDKCLLVTGAFRRSVISHPTPPIGLSGHL